MSQATSVGSRNDIVELDRRFLDTTAQSALEDGYTANYRGFAEAKFGYPWGELLKRDVIVIRGGAGSGKSTEVRLQAQRLRASGQLAFVVRLEALCRGDIEQSFVLEDPASRSNFAEWRQSHRPAYLFLDALDEARLPSGKNAAILQAAFENLFRATKKWGHTLKVIIATRPSEWHGETDRAILNELVDQLRAHAPEKERKSTTISVFNIADLVEVDLRRLAAARLEYPTPFFKAVEKSLIYSLMRTPLEARFLMDIWRDKLSQNVDIDKIFKSRTQVFEAVIRHSLQPEDSETRRSDLDPVGARRAAQRLAAVSVLTNLRILYWEGNDLSSINAVDVLAQDQDRWNEKACRQLLSCGLFHPALADRIEFSHNEVRDFLAASFFSESLKNNAASMDIIEPLLVRAAGTIQIPSEFDHVAGWLASLNPLARKFVSTVKPSLILRTGDPSRLSDAERAFALNAHIALYSDRKFRGEFFNDDALERFASSGFEPTVRTLLETRQSPEVGRVLTRIAKLGRMSGLSSELGRIAIDPETDFGTRSNAMEALASFGDTLHRDTIKHALLSAEFPESFEPFEYGVWNEFLLNGIRYVFQAEPDFDLAASLLDKFHREFKNIGSGTDTTFIEILSNASSDDLVGWLEVLMPRMASAPYNDDHLPTVSELYLVLAPAIAFLIGRLLESSQSLSSSGLDAIEYLYATDRYNFPGRYDGSYGVFETALAASSETKYRLIERRLREVKRSKDAFLTATRIMSPFDESLADVPKIFSREDAEPWIRIILTQSDAQTTLIVIEIADWIIRNFTTNASRERERNTLAKIGALSNFPEVRAKYAFNWREAFGRFKSNAKYRLSSVKRRLNKAGRQLKNWRYKAEVTARYWLKANAISKGTFFAPLYNELQGHLNDLGEKVIASIQQEHGGHIAEAFCKGYITFWRNHPIGLDALNTFGALVGLTGLYLEKPAALAKLNQWEAEIAFRYALSNLNSFPDWTEAVVRTQPEIFLKVMEPLILEGLTAPKRDQPFASDLFTKLSHVSEFAASLIAPTIFEQLKRQLPENIEDLAIGVELITHAQDLLPEQLVPYAQHSCEQLLGSGAYSAAWVFLDALMALDADIAWAVVESFFLSNGLVTRAEIFVQFLGRDRRRARNRANRYRRRSLQTNGPVLQNLIRLTYLAHPPQNDEQHEDGYTPDFKDRATDMRGWYLNKVLELSTTDAVAILDELANLPELQQHRDILLYNRDHAISVAAVAPKLSMLDACSAIEGFDIAPQTPEAFRNLVRRHLVAILTRLKEWDDNEGRVFREGAGDENDLSNWLSGRLRDAGGSIYTSLRELQNAGSNRPDLRVQGSQSLGKIALEVKIADNWTGTELLGKAKSQLFYQYLLEPTTHSGFYVLVNTNKPTFAKRVDGKTLRFDDLVTLIKERTGIWLESLGGGKVIEVIGIELPFDQKPIRQRKPKK